ncbi:MAG TPA: acyl-CoA dehydrogenase family protein [Dehalococcoidia bacterium]|nr:acyl-CoA dehydrogenase family protein [Dehalococcoidia bacterium]
MAPDMAPESSRGEDWIDKARHLRSVIEKHRDQIDTERQLSVALVEALRDAGLFSLLLPRSLGGEELNLATFLQVVEEVSAADGSVGWNLQIGSNGGIFAAHLPRDVAITIFNHPGVILAGSFHMKGPCVARVVDGGYRVTGHWDFGSGCQQATWLAGGCIIMEGDKPRLGTHGSPEPHVLFFRRTEGEILDTWHVSGLRGTGSHDFRATNTFVPEGYLVRLLTGRPVEFGTLYRFPLTTLLALLLAPVATGIARATIDALITLATVKTPAA